MTFSPRTVLPSFHGRITFEMVLTPIVLRLISAWLSDTPVVHGHDRERTAERRRDRNAVVLRCGGSHCLIRGSAAVSYEWRAARSCKRARTLIVARAS